ncbi:MAG: hypothetical protein HY287_14530 [Planctomycetes bacterium]|nr:hypothetical protein [Planctomycetota bacterium]MBI3835539.1 hypothetical protein [Planctomycetota bacterium]
MKTNWQKLWMLASIVGLSGGCAARKADFSKIQQPPRPTELEAYDVFVGTWNWEAEMLNADEQDKAWTGKAEWKWTLDKRCLRGAFQSQSKRTKFEAEGIWSWHPRDKQYIWGMFNNWGYPQRGTASYDAANKRWTMDYKSIGLDGTTSYGRYCMSVVDHDTLDWHMTEWADRIHMVKKVEMTGKYKRQK